MRLFKILSNGHDVGLRVIATSLEDADLKVQATLKVIRNTSVTVSMQKPLCQAHGLAERCPLEAETHELCRAHYHERGNIKRPCKMKDCKRGHYAKGFCRGHYLKDYYGRTAVNKTYPNRKK